MTHFHVNKPLNNRHLINNVRYNKATPPCVIQGRHNANTVHITRCVWVLHELWVSCHKITAIHEGGTEVQALPFGNPGLPCQQFSFRWFKTNFIRTDLDGQLQIEAVSYFF